MTQYVNILRSEINTGRMSLKPGVIELLNDLENLEIVLVVVGIEEDASLPDAQVAA